MVGGIFQYRDSITMTSVSATPKKVDTKIVAIIVDKNLYNNSRIQTEIKRYATQYVQQKILNSNALVFPIDTDTIHSWDIAKLLENLYYWWVKKEPSTLEWVVLIGNKVPLPVVNDDGVIFSTIFPYVDFDDPKFYRDLDSQYFLPNGVVKAQPEIRESVINLGDNPNDYVTFFNNVKKYNSDSNTYVGDRIWYDDFIAQKQSYNELALDSYINNFVFAEDFAYHRFNPLAIDFFNSRSDGANKEMMSSLAKTIQWRDDDYAKTAQWVINGLLVEYNGQSQSQTDMIPTVFVDDALQWFLKPYRDLYGVTETARMRDNILSSGRWKTNDIDDHASKIEYVDSLFTKELGTAQVPLMVEANKYFEDALVTTVSWNQYALHIALPRMGEIYKNKETVYWWNESKANQDLLTAIERGKWKIKKFLNDLTKDYIPSGIYEAFYYWRNVSTIDTIDETTIFVGTPSPIDYDLGNIKNLTGVKTAGTLWLSQAILSQFVEANRWYNTDLIMSDLDFKTKNNICVREKVESEWLKKKAKQEALKNEWFGMEEYVQGYLWWNTPLYLTGWGDNNKPLELVNKSLGSNWYDRWWKSEWMLENAESLKPDPEDLADDKEELQKEMQQDIQIMRTEWATSQEIQERIQEFNDAIQNLENGIIEQSGPIFDIAGSQRVPVEDIAPWMFAENLQAWFLQRTVYIQVKKRKILNRWKAWLTLVNPCNTDTIDAVPLTMHNLYDPTNFVESQSEWFSKTITVNWKKISSLSTEKVCPSTPTSWSSCYPNDNGKPLEKLDIETDTGTITYKVDVRNSCDWSRATGTVCYEPISAWEFYQIQTIDYTTIDSLSIHNSPTPEEIAELNMVTLSRPIDSVRYLTFKGVWWSQIVFPFPNLYEVPIYTGTNGMLELMSKDNIKQSIRTYLRNIVINYNNILKEEQSKSTTFYSTNHTLFNELSTITPLANPRYLAVNKYNKLIDTNIFNNLISDEVVDSIASLLYMENSILPYKTQSTTVAQEYDQIYNWANITNKKKLILDKYITIQTPQSPLDIPWYISDGYEVINLISDGDDGIVTAWWPSWLTTATTKIKQDKERKEKTESLWRNNGSGKEWSYKDECSAPYGEPVLLVDLSTMEFPWFNVLKCWIDNISVPKLAFDFGNAEWPVFTQGFFKWFLNTNQNNNTDTYTLWKLQWDETNQNIILSDSIDIDLTHQSYLLDNKLSELIPKLTITKTKEITWTQRLYLSSTGDVCLMIGWRNTCRQEFSVNLSDTHYISPEISPITNKAWESILSVQICSGNTKTSCMLRNFVYFIVPWLPTSWEIRLPTETSTTIPFLSATQIPLTFSTKDTYWNEADSSMLSLSLQSDGGSFPSGWTGYSVTNTRTTIPFIAPKVDKSQIVTLSLLDKSNENILNDKIITEKKITVVPWSLAIQWNSYYKDWAVNYTLSKQREEIFWHDLTVDISKIPRFILDLQWPDWKKISGPILVGSEQWLFSVSEVIITGARAKIPMTWLQQTQTLIFDGKNTKDIVIIPRMKENVWEDVILFTFPDGTQKKIPIIIQSSWIATNALIHTETNKQLFDRKEQFSATIELLDDRDNLIVWEHSLNLQRFWSLQILWQDTIIIKNGIAKIPLSTDIEWWNWYLLASLKNDSDIFSPGILQIRTKQTLIPKNNINGLYLNIAWTNRGNTTDSQEDYYDMIPQILQTSKILSVTTQLVDPAQLKRTLVMIGDDFSLIGEQKDKWILVQTWWVVIAQDPLEKRQVTLWLVQDMVNAKSLMPAVSLYKEDYNLKVKKQWEKWSTNTKMLLSLIDTNSEYNPIKNPSLEESKDPNQNIWRRASQQHLTQFWQWKSVGEATKHNASEFLINYGDPLITRKDNNNPIENTTMDSWPGQLMLNDSTKTIKKVLSIDVDGDDFDDIVTVFTDGSVIWSKQNGWKDKLFIEMWPLLQIYGSIKDVFWWDTQWDKFDDIIIQTQQDDLRVYTNQNGKFHVDWYPLCIDPDQRDNFPWRVSDVDQRFVEDMNNDGIVDIILNRWWEIRIIYWWESNNGYSYISQNILWCDTGRQSRQERFINIVDHLWVQLHSGDVVDLSLIRWQWLSTENVPNIGMQETVLSTDIEKKIVDTLNIDKTTIENLKNWQWWIALPNLSAFPINDIVADAADDILRRSVSPIDFYPSYENKQTLQQNDIRYITVSNLESSDLIQSYKTYTDINGGILQKWDKVKVTININWRRTTPLTYIERIQWPWNIIMSWATISWWDRWTLWTDAEYTALDGGDDFNFVIDNIRLWSRGNVTFSYELEFLWDAPITIALSDRNHDGYIDISLYPVDSCSRYIQTYINTRTNPKSYITQWIDLNDKLEKATAKWSQHMSDFLEWVTKDLEKVAQDPKNIQNYEPLQNVVSEKMDVWWFFKDMVNWWQAFNINLDFVEQFDFMNNEEVKKALDGLCGWFSKDGFSIPMPFNMGFLAPWTFNIMWCTPKWQIIPDIFPKDNGFPIIAFPATFVSPVWPLPLPFPFWGLQKWSTDSYGYYGFPAPWWVYPSMIRLYIVPTITMRVGIAICLWPQVVGEKIPIPLSMISGNCIVVVPWKSWDDQNWWIQQEEYLSDEDKSDLAYFDQCLQQTTIVSWNSNSLPTQGTKTGSPFVMTSNKWWRPEPLQLESGTYFGVINLEKTPIISQDSDFGWWWVVLQWGKVVTPKVLWWWSKGLVACIVQDWMDRQVNYLINNFTTMQIGVYLPDLTQLWQGFDSLGQQLQSDDNIFSTNTISKTSNDSSNDVMTNIKNELISEEQITNLSDTISNPFETISKLFEQVPLINISTQDIVVNIPMLYSEDVTRYQAELSSRWERNTQVAKDWEGLIVGVMGICSQKLWLLWNDMQLTDISTIRQRVQERKKQREIAWDIEQNSDLLACEELFIGKTSQQLDSIVAAIWKSTQFQSRIAENIRILEKYQRFPLQLYQWTHIIDRYMVEITSMVENFLWYINTWLHTNATRFEQYVDAIITISNAMKTWQMILDLSVNWQKKCSNCTVDNYDSYGCTLWSLCGKLQLPVLKLPPFKIPNIYIDLSHIDLGIDLTVPSFRFNPVSVPLASLPDLPQPPVLSTELDFSWLIDIPIPEIPLLPEPPILPELPSFIPNITLELPVLPPAPKIPDLAPSLQTAIDLVWFFVNVYCIVKWGIGLVGESNVKSHIEQLTQRTDSIPFFDNLNLTNVLSYWEDKLQWFDYKIDAFLDFTMTFSQVYDLISSLVDQVNQQTKKLSDRDPNSSLNKVREGLDKANDATQRNIDVSIGYNSDVSLVALDDERKNIIEVSEYMMNLSDTPVSYKNELKQIIDVTNTSSKFIAQHDTIGTIHKDVTTDLWNYRKEIQKLAWYIENYDTFLETISDKKYSYSGSLEYKSSLFKNTGEKELPQRSLLSDYTLLQQKLLSNYDKWLQQVKDSSNYKEVDVLRWEIAYLSEGMSLIDRVYNNNENAQYELSSLQRKYNAIDTLAYNNQAVVCTTPDLWLWVEQWEEYSLPYSFLTAQNWWTTNPVSVPSFDVSNLYDFSSQKNKIIVPFKNTTGTYSTDVIQSDYFTEGTQWHKILDSNGDKISDVIHRNMTQSWIKYGNQNNQRIVSTLYSRSSRYYEAPVWNNPNDRISSNWKIDSDWYITLQGRQFKVYSPDLSVKNLRVDSQDYDSFTVSWTNSERQQPVDAYLLEINTLPTTYYYKDYDKKQYDRQNTQRSRYVMLVPEDVRAMTWMNIENRKIELIDQLDKFDISTLLTGTIIDILPYDRSSSTIYYGFSELPRQRYYIRVASLSLDTNKRLFGKDEEIYSLSSPWSHQRVAGQQLIADNDGPSPKVQLIREKTRGIVDEGISLEWLVNTSYSLKVQRDDPSGVEKSWIISQTWQKLQEVIWSTVTLTGLYFTSDGTLDYTIGASDFNSNNTTEIVKLSIQVPSLSIDDIVSTNVVPWWLVINTSLSQWLDEWNIRFERKRNNVRTILSEWSNFPDTWFYTLWFDQTFLTWWIFNKKDGIEFYSVGWVSIATMDRQNGKITIDPRFEKRVIIKPNLITQRPELILYDTQNNTNLFSVRPKMQQITMNAGNTTSLLDIKGAWYGSFDGWVCLQNNNNECIVVVNEQRDMAVVLHPYNTSLQWLYKYDSITQQTSIILTDGWIHLWTINFIATLP